MVGSTVAGVSHLADRLRGDPAAVGPIGIRTASARTVGGPGWPSEALTWELGRAGLVVAVARATSRGRHRWYAHVIGPDVVLVEQVGPGAPRRFALPAAELTDLVLAAVVHPATGDAAGPSVLLSSADPPGELGRSLLRADVAVRHAGEPDTGTVSVFTGPRGAWLVTGRGGPIPLAHPMGAAQLRARLRELLGTLRAEADLLDRSAQLS